MRKQLGKNEIRGYNQQIAELYRQSDFIGKKSNAEQSDRLLIIDRIIFIPLRREDQRLLRIELFDRKI